MKEIIVSQDENGEWIAKSLRLPGYIARGRTQAEVIHKMRSALLLYFPCADDCKKKEDNNSEDTNKAML
jgi:predicted RNase H-like HicB family nuclease